MDKILRVNINVIGEMRKLRETAYADRLAWIDELIQNTQRAGAKNVWIQVFPDKFIIADDGIGCTDPSVVFEKNISGWGQEIRSSENPFGEGFFSVIMVANMVKVRSIGFEATFDVRKMFQENTLDCITVREWHKRKRGFLVELSDLEDEYDPIDVRIRVKEVVEYIDGINFYLDNEKLLHKKFTDASHNLAKIINSDLARGWLAPFRWGSSYDGFDGDKIKIYAQQRFVKDLYYPGIQGVLEIKNNSVDLRSPDRKDIIDNSKYERFLEFVNSEIKEILIDILRYKGDEEIDKYADVIYRYLDVDEYEDLLRFISLSEYKEIQQLEESSNKQNNNVDFDAVAAQLSQAQRSDETLKTVLIQTSSSSYIPLGVSVKESKRIGKKLDEIKFRDIVFYVRKNEIDDYQDKINLAEYYGITVILARNSLEESVLVKKNCQHVKDLNEKIRLSANLTNVGAISEKEKRAMYLFEIISRALGFKRNIFKIGDMTTYKNISINGVDVKKEEIKALALVQGSDIYIDRKSLNDSNLIASDSKDLTYNDKVFIMNNLIIIAHELAHVMYNTIDNTKEHAEAQLQIIDKIVKGVFK
jgi:hypothetical protein